MDAVLPSGTVSLLFSDVEGSTVLLSRLGPAYAEALDGQRRVLRAAWAAHGGTELGTEGDSFFVVFRTAEGAVSAAAQAQRELAECAWPGGEQVRVRIGVHTGSPQVHDGGYVGMDVHRAARIAAAAHGGQVVISSATAELVGSCLPERVGLRDLGSHQLKDIQMAEHLLQLVVDGVASEFPPLRTLGAASSLPRPATPLVGRNGEVTLLTTLLGSPGVRLVTLTGPGGSGKTRLAVGVAHHSVRTFPDGVFFVPLAAVTTPEVMWTSIAEVLGVPPEGRVPPGFFSHVAHRSALFVLDNLEQLPGSDKVVSELLAAAPQVVVMATSRRPLRVAGELQHAVPPLELPEVADLAQAAESGAVQLFVQHAQAVKASFTLTDANTVDVVQVCRRLDGLPLAIELAAARCKLLSPAALLARLDKALELKDTGVDRPARQQTLRETIAWSYQLLTPDQQAFFRRLGVFAGGADLDAITAVTVGAFTAADPLDVVAELVDASLVTITEGTGGEPRVGMLETVRAFALDQLSATEEAAAVRYAHTKRYLHTAEQLKSTSQTDYLEARTLAETELDNFREALRRTLQPPTGETTDSDQVSLGLQLCAALGWLWYTGGYLAEGRGWYEQAIQQAGGTPTTALADCLSGLADVLVHQGEPQRAGDLAISSLKMARTLGDEKPISRALRMLAIAQAELGNLGAARRSFEGELALHRRAGDRYWVARTLGNLGVVAIHEGNYERAEKSMLEAKKIFEEFGALYDIALGGQNLAHVLGLSGRTGEAHDRVRHLVDTVLEIRDPNLTVGFAETYMDIIARLGDGRSVARLFGAAEAMRERNALQRPHRQDDSVLAAVSSAQQLISEEEWDRHYQLGRGEPLEDLLRHLGQA